jgi:hypothetical protein
MYCVYLISYRGNKLPPFYVGSTSMEKLQNGYKGSVSSKIYGPIWRSEIKKRPDMFCIRPLSARYSSRDDAYDAEDRLLRALGAVRSSMYVNRRCAAGLGYHPTGEDSHRHHVPHTAEALAKMSLVHTGKTITPAHRQLISLVHSGKPKSAQHRERISASKLGKRATSITRAKMQASATGRKASEATKTKQSVIASGRSWWNNNGQSTLARMCPGEGWKKGRR